MARTPKPSSLTAVTIDSTPNYFIEYNYLYLANTHYQKSAALSVIRKAVNYLNT